MEFNWNQNGINNFMLELESTRSTSRHIACAGYGWIRWGRVSQPGPHVTIRPTHAWRGEVWPVRTHKNYIVGWSILVPCILVGGRPMCQNLRVGPDWAHSRVNENPLGCVRKTFFGPYFSLVGGIIRLGANMPKKHFDPVSQYFPSIHFHKGKYWPTG